MSKDKRVARKAKRKELKKQRNEKFNAVVEQFKHIKDIELNDNMNYKEIFNEIWPFLRVSLDFTIILEVTGDKFDDKLEKVLIIGNKIEGSATPDNKDMDEFYSKLSKVWKKIDFSINLAKTFTNDTQDEVLDRILEMGEWILGEEK